MEAQFGPLDKRIKMTDINRDETVQTNSQEQYFDQKRNEEIFEEVKIEPVDEKLRRYKSNWLRHVTRTKNKRMPKIT